MIKLIRLILLCFKYGHDLPSGYMCSSARCNDWHSVCRRCGRVVVLRRVAETDDDFLDRQW